MEHHHPTEEGGEEMPKQLQREGGPIPGKANGPKQQPACPHSCFAQADSAQLFFIPVWKGPQRTQLPPSPWGLRRLP